MVIDAPLDAPKEYVFLMYLQAGPPGINRSFNIGWANGNQDVVKINPLQSELQNRVEGSLALTEGASMYLLLRTVPLPFCRNDGFI